MKHLLITTFIVLLFLTGKASPFSGQTEISILTCSPGAELYSLFGHTAIRVHDPKTKTDIVFNYGTFDFQTPHFYLKYAQGLLPYQLSFTHFDRFMLSYQMDGRTVYSQRLLLDSLQTQKLADLLIENYRPENREYLYNFLFDNCTTRSRDIILKSIGKDVEWNGVDCHKSFWNLLDEYLVASPWVEWGIHTILGQRGNREATTFQYMFLPDYLMYQLETARIDNRHLAAETEVLYRAPEQEMNNPWYFHPVFVFGLGTLLLAFLIWKSGSVSLLNITTFLFFTFSGIVGCLIVFLGGFTAHPITAPNWNILWANPLNLIALIFVLKRNISYITRIYLKIYMTILVIAIPTWIVCQPAVPAASVFLIGMLIFICLQLRAKKNE